MFSETAQFYDAIYAAFKDYAAEAAGLTSRLRDAYPGARTILDVGCGTGEHARRLQVNHGFEVDGLDLDPALLAAARLKLPNGRFFVADMAAFDLGRRYDAVICLFSSIGYLRTLDRVTAALRCFGRHLQPGGVVLVEPWFAPGVLQEGTRSVHRAEVGAVRIERTSQLVIEEKISRIRFEYRIEDGGNVTLKEEFHELGLFTPEEMLACFREAGLTAEFDPVGLTGRGLYLARALGSA